MAAPFPGGLLFSARLLLSCLSWDEVEVIPAKKKFSGLLRVCGVVDEAVPVDARPLLAKSMSAVEYPRTCALMNCFNQYDGGYRARLGRTDSPRGPVRRRR